MMVSTVLKVRRYRRRFGAMLILAGVAWLTCSAISSSKTGEHLWIFGSNKMSAVSPGKTLKGSLLVFNPATSTVRIKTAPGCGCESLDPATLSMPGLSIAKIYYSIDTENLAPGVHPKGFGLFCWSGALSWSEPIVVDLFVPDK